MKILAVQNRMGIGDTIIFLPFIKALFKKYNSPISLLVKESSKAWVHKPFHQKKLFPPLVLLKHFLQIVYLMRQTLQNEVSSFLKILK